MKKVMIMFLPLLLSMIGGCGNGNDKKLASLQDSLSAKILILQSSYVTKNAGLNQNSLLKWLTDVNQNTHFDVDVRSTEQIFIVNKKGTLYSVLTREVGSDVLNASLQENINE